MFCTSGGLLFLWYFTLIRTSMWPWHSQLLMFLGRRRLLKHGYFSLVQCPIYGPSIGAPWIQLGIFSILTLRLSTLKKPKYTTRGNCDISQDIHNQSTEPFWQLHQSVHPTSLPEDRPKFSSKEIINAPAHEPEELHETRTLQARSLVDGKSQSVFISRHARRSIHLGGRERKEGEVLRILISLIAGE